MSSGEPVSIRVLDREYTIGVAPEERDALVEAARQLDARMREIRGNNRMAGVDRLAVLAALNLAHELKQLQTEQHTRERALRQALGALERRLDTIE